MKKRFVCLLMILTFFACRGYRGKSNPLSPQEQEFGDQAQVVQQQTEQLRDAAPDAVKPSISTLADQAATFHSLCRRLGSNSLEAHNAFDKVWFQTSEIEKNVTAQSYPDFYPKWEKVRNDYILPLAKKLGYRPDAE